ncbi:hypothetical protein [Azospirillum sp. SYSU D00513]|uniref:glycine-rich domain-containing protein n=1 Tax=Azospirillum sp. SYSU D00513 TaxID=2812561 RepID=UPI001A96B19C|nr:hypothetical protein [Azospirillum sp. SYSU D00513]
MTFIQKVNSLDFQFIVDGLINTDGIHPEIATQAVDLYRQFLVAVAMNPNENIVPTKLVDKAWHHHILHTRRYREDCLFLVGEIIDHDPTVYRTEAYDRAWEKTRKLVAYGNTMPVSPYVDGISAGAGCFERPRAEATDSAGAGCFFEKRSIPPNESATGAGCFVARKEAENSADVNVGAGCFVVKKAAKNTSELNAGAGCFVTQGTQSLRSELMAGAGCFVVRQAA